VTGAAVVPATSATITPELSAKRARLNAIPAERNAARRAGDVAAVLRLEVEAEDLAGEIGELEQQLRAAAAQEQASREVASAERQRIVRAELEAAVATESAAVGHALDQLATKSGQLRRAVEALAAMEPDPERQRLVVQQRCGGGVVQFAGETLAAWLSHDPRAQWDLAVLDRIDGPTGETLRSLRDHFFSK